MLPVLSALPPRAQKALTMSAGATMVAFSATMVQFRRRDAAGRWDANGWWEQSASNGDGWESSWRALVWFVLTV